MFFTQFQLVREVMDGGFLRAKITKPFGDRSDSWFRKSFKPEMVRVTEVMPGRWLASRYGPGYREYSMNGPIPDLRYQEFEVRKYGIPIPSGRGYVRDTFIEDFEGGGYGTAPVYFYLLREVSEPFLENEMILAGYQILIDIEQFPYVHWIERDALPGTQESVIGKVDSCLLYLVCLFLDSELDMDVDVLVDSIVLPGVRLPYRKSYGVCSYVNYRISHLKHEKKRKLEQLYKCLGLLDEGVDRDTIVKRVGRWRRAESIPSPRYFLRFVKLFAGGRSLRKFLNEQALVGVFHAVQLIQKCPNDDGTPDYRLESDAFYRDRVHFWYEKLTEHYADVLTRRRKERDVEGGLDRDR